MLPIKIDLSKHKRGAKWTTKCLRTWGRNRTRRRRIRDSLWLAGPELEESSKEDTETESDNEIEYEYEFWNWKYKTWTWILKLKI
jgi:hypothetical protein